MKVLFIVGTCLSKNTSANMSHNSYIRGFVENGCEVDVIMETDSWGEKDYFLKKIDGVSYTEFQSTSRADRIRARLRGKATGISQPLSDANSIDAPAKRSIYLCLRGMAKKLFYAVFPQDKVYPLDKVWLNRSQSFKSTKKYDLVVSNSSPAASHKLAMLLLEKGNIHAKRWIQIWEDPWSHDIYGNHSTLIEQEEKKLLDAADEILYVSPITTEYQKGFFPSAAHKMSTIPLPYLDFDEECPQYSSTDITYGYFGDYYSFTRNLLPFFNSLNNSRRKGYIYGDSNLSLKSECIDIHPRVTLDVLSEVQNKTTVLVHLSNLNGGQIPGKIYHYSATRKPILFILDGTENEQEILRNYFGGMNRYYFCENTEDSILNALQKIENELLSKNEVPVTKFSPKNVVKSILDESYKL